MCAPYPKPVFIAGLRLQLSRLAIIRLPACLPTGSGIVVILVLPMTTLQSLLKFKEPGVTVGPHVLLVTGAHLAGAA